MAGYFEHGARPLQPEDVHGARQLLIGTLGITPYIDRALEVLDLAGRGPDPEHQGLVIARDGTVAALALFGAVAGSAGAWRVHVLALAPAVIDGDVSRRLIEAVEDRARSGGGRFLLAELADDPALGVATAALHDRGFREETRIPDFFRDGIALTFLRRAL